MCVCVCVLSPLYSSCCLFSATRTAHLDTHTPHSILSFLPPTTLFSAQCPNDCSGHGLCGKEGATKGRCMCVAGWVSVDCSKHSNAVLRRKSEACAHTCSPAHGTCKMGRCACEPGWAGKRCDQAICPNMCTAVGNGKFRGVCANGKVRDVRVYACSTLWWLRWSIIISGAIAHFLPPLPHSPAPFCFHQCACDVGFAGDDCGYECPNRCSSHGICTSTMLRPSRGDAVSHRCLCEPGWTAMDCSETAASVTAIAVTGSRGGSTGEQ